MGGYRSTDSKTSRLAYEQMERDGSLSRKRLEIVSVLVMHEGSWTAGEIAFLLRANRNNVATRLTELEYLGVVRKVSERSCEVSKKTCWTWEMTGNQPSGAICRPESLSARVKRLEAELQEARDTILDLFCQACTIADKGKIKYDHMCRGTYEYVQEDLISWGLIKIEDCIRK